MGLGRNRLQEGQSAFERVTKASSLLPILENRLPKSCNVYNMVRIHHKFQNEMSFYILNTNKDTQFSDFWIIGTFLREDYGLDVNISAPQDLSRSTEFKAALITAVKFAEPFIFAATDLEICSLIEECVLEGTGKIPLSGKNQMFYAIEHQPIPARLNLVSSHVELKQLDIQLGSKFLVSNWPFAKSGSLAYVRKLIERNPSAGVYVDGKIVCGAVLNGSGLISCLYTEETQRHKGYATICMNYFISVLLQDHLIPCCTVENHNLASLALQNKIGLKVSHEASYISKST